jgi:DNA-binding winged helix-turn-helix (wHTH) protein
LEVLSTPNITRYIPAAEESTPEPAMISGKRNTYVFGPFRLDTTRRILYSGLVPTPIPERPFQILLALIHAGGDVVDRETLARQVWGDEGVSDTNVNQHIYLLRLLLRDRKDERSYIITVPGEGYRFAAPVTVAPEDEDQFVEDAIRSAGYVLNVGDELFQQYCRGSYYLDRRTAQSLRAAAQAFELALKIDRDHVPSLIGLARANALLAEYWHEPPYAAFPRAKTAITRALQLDPRSSMAHAVLSEIHLFCDWDWSKARKTLIAAIKLNPQSTFARNNAAWYHICRRDLTRALVEVRQALVVEPASLPLQLLLARVLVHSGSYVVAIADMTNMLTIDPSYALARRYRAQAYLLAEHAQEAIDDLLALPEDAAEDLSFRLPMLARAYANLKDQRAVEIYHQLRTRARNEYVPYWNLALVAVALGHQNEAIRYLQSALKDQEPTLLFLRTLPWFRAIWRRRELRRILTEIGP